MKKQPNPQLKSCIYLILCCLFHVHFIFAQNEPLLKADQMPTFPGGEVALKKYIDAKLGYSSDPPIGVEKLVRTRFVVNKDGSIQKVEIIEGIDDTLDRKALKLISTMPRWVPGKHNKQTVAVRMDLPIPFIVAEIEPPTLEPEVEPAPAPEPVVEPAPALNPDNIPPSSRQEIFKIIEKMPSFPDGQMALLHYLAQNITYPDTAIKNKVEGMVVVQFIVERDGSLSGVNVVKGIGAGCDEEAARVVSMMPKWIPGMHRGQLVRVQFNLPIRFKLE